MSAGTSPLHMKEADPEAREPSPQVFADSQGGGNRYGWLTMKGEGNSRAPQANTLPIWIGEGFMGK